MLRQRWWRGQVEARFANMPPCLVGMEACVGAHHLSRKLQGFGHDARLIPAKYVRPYSKGQKNDFRDAEAIMKPPSPRVRAAVNAAALACVAIRNSNGKVPTVSRNGGMRPPAMSAEHLAAFAEASAAASCGRRSSASACLGLDERRDDRGCSTSANRVTVARCASMPRPECANAECRTRPKIGGQTDADVTA